jgi:outer membrane protein assembly factor BamA
MKSQKFQLQRLIMGLICLLVLNPAAYADKTEEILTVRTLTIEGLKRTRMGAVRHIVNIEKGDPWTDEARDLVERRLNNYGTFRNISLKEKIDENFVDLIIHLEDRWTLFPFPIVTTGSGSSYGLGLFERNFLGTQKTAGMIALIKEKKPRFFALYSDPHFLSWDWELTLIGGYRDEMITDFDEERISAGGLVRYRFNDFVSVGGGYSFNNVTHKGGAVTPVDGKSHTLSLDFIYNRLYFDEDYVDGLSLGLSLQRELWYSDFSYTLAGLNASFYKKAFFHHTIALQNILSLSWDAPYGYTYILGGKGGRGTLPVKGYDDNEFLADQVLSGTLEYRIPFYTSRVFILSAVTFYDYAFYSEKVESLFSSEFIYSFGFSVRLYLRRLALPAFQIYAAYVPEKDRYEIGLSIGASFR